MIIEFTPADGEARRWDLKTTAILIPERRPWRRSAGSGGRR